MYLAWYEPAKIPLEQKIEDAIQAYQRRHGRLPTIALCSACDKGDVASVNGCKVDAHDMVRKNNVYVGVA